MSTDQIPYQPEDPAAVSSVPVVPEQAAVQQVQGIPVAQFEGEYIRHMLGKIPGLEIGMTEGYPKGTVLDLQVRVRVRDIAFVDKKVRNQREPVPTRVHTLVYEHVQIAGAYTMAQAEAMSPGVVGGASE